MTPAPRAGNGISMAQLTTLPSEILTNILYRCELLSLKQLRRSSTILRDLATPRLFETVDLYPHLQHFGKILELSKHPPIRVHVRQINYDLRFVTFPRRIIKRIESVYSTNIDQAQSDLALQRARDFEKQTLDQRRDNDIELLYLHDILRNLPALEQITVVADHWSSHDLNDLPDIYQRLRSVTSGTLPDADLEHGAHRFADQLVSAKQALFASHNLRQPIKRLIIRGGYYNHIMAFEPQGKHIDMLQPLFSRLVGLDLDAQLWTQPAPANLMRNLGAVLNMATSLTELSLGFMESRHGMTFTEDGDYDEEEYHSVVELLDSALPDGRKSDWGRKLRFLKLDGLHCRHHEFKRLLKRVSSTLRRLFLIDFALIPDREWQQKSCLVSLLEDIRSATNLDEVYIGGNLSNSGAQEWAVGDEESVQRCHQELTHDWILGKAESCPIELLRIVPPAQDFTQEQYDALPEWDDSWTVLDDYLDHTRGADIPSEDEGEDDDDEEEDDDDDGYGYGYGYGYGDVYGYEYGDGHGDEDGDDSESDSDRGTSTFSNPADMIPDSVVLPFVETAMGISVPGRHPTHTNYDWLAEDVD